MNQLVVRYLKDKLKTVPPALDPERFLENASRPKAKSRFPASLSRPIHG